MQQREKRKHVYPIYNSLAITVLQTLVFSDR